MGYKTPDQIAVAAVNGGIAKANLSPDRMLVGGVLAGAYIGFAGLVGIIGTSGLPTATWGTLPTLIFGLAFSLGLILVIVAGSELLTGNMALLPLAFFSRRITVGRVGMSLALVTIGNLLGALLVAYVFAVKTGVIGTPSSAPGSTGALTFQRLSGIADGKALVETHLQVILRAVACNWLVCLGVWMALAAEDIAGKVLAIVFPITAFVAMGFDHVVANMFFLPAAMFAHVPGLTWGDVWDNLWEAYVGNFIGGGLFVAGAYWFLYLRGRNTSTRPDGVVDTAAPDDRSHAGQHAAGPR
ncbi:formate/nitrite transporter family protein [Nakamurella endophytica]|uniref:Transporter YrhG n=1 Tax=Nakamurella endophytica TaxID=1748367 RepID=A0A917WF99_9ACTN|nr:formate/nitrite transporter family protein [Nakamurella endophytica]GGL98175.1 putative transporter YrhG [Nakamurella endophytica]